MTDFKTLEEFVAGLRDRADWLKSRVPYSQSTHQAMDFSETSECCDAIATAIETMAARLNVDRSGKSHLGYVPVSLGELYQILPILTPTKLTKTLQARVSELETALLVLQEAELNAG